MVFASLLVAGTISARADEFKFEAQLIWATNDQKSPEEKHKAVEAEIQKKLESLGLKWKNFFEVKRVAFTAPKGESGKVVISEKCSISVKVLEDKKLEVIFYGKKGEVCSRQIQPLKTDEVLVHGGNAANETAWLVTLKRLK